MNYGSTATDAYNRTELGSNHALGSCMLPQLLLPYCSTWPDHIKVCVLVKFIRIGHQAGWMRPSYQAVVPARATPLWGGKDNARLQ